MSTVEEQTITMDEENKETDKNISIQSQPGVPEGIDESGIEIGAKTKETSDNEEENEEGLMLGDICKIETAKYGTVKGTIYYLDNEYLLRILSQTDTNVLYDFPISDGDFIPELGITTFKLIKKHTREGFIANQFFEVGQILNSYTSDGSKGPSYTIDSINEDLDRMTLVDETEKKIELDCNFIGIPNDLPFKILQIESSATEELLNTVEEPAQEGKESKESKEDKEEPEFEDEEFEDEDYELIEAVEATNTQFKGIAQIYEKKPSERIYSEIDQKNEFLVDLLSMEDTIQQNNPYILKKIRRFVEICSSLKNSIIKRSKNGIPDGEEITHLRTLMDILKTKVTPIARPVLDTIRVIVADAESGDIETPQVKRYILRDVIEKSNEILKFDKESLNIDPGIGIPEWYRTLNTLFTMYPMGDDYSVSDSYNKTDYTFVEDSEFFRHSIPGSPELQGLIKIGSKKYDSELFSEKSELFINTVSQSLRRGHGPTLRALEKGGTEMSIAADKAPIKGYVLFPYNTVNYGIIGSIRTGSLWETMYRSMSQKTWMSNILEQLDGIQDEKNAQNILYISNEDPSGIQITFSDYLTVLLKSLILRGSGDLTTLKMDLGILDMELTSEQEERVQNRVTEVLKSLRSMIIELRKKELPKDSEIHPVFEDTSIQTHLSTLLPKHTLLNDIIKKMKQYTPGYESVDIASMASLFIHAYDYILNAYGEKNPEGTKKATIRYASEISLRNIKTVLEFEKLKQNLGSPPEVNPCEHVETLELIRKVSDENERIGLLLQFVSRYKGPRDENWVKCYLCDKHLICQHEIIQIQQYLHPNDKKVLQKELILQYAGGLFGSNYICKNCGLPISELSYDISAKVNTTGQSMMDMESDSSVNTINYEQIKYLFTIKKEEESPTLHFEKDTAANEDIYKILRVITDAIGVNLDENGIYKIIDRVKEELTQITSLKQYNEEKKKRVEKGEKTLPEYIVYYSRKKIAFVATYILLEIQTHIPDYKINFYAEGCGKAGFGGYPLIPGSTPDNAEDAIGLRYIACVLSTIDRDDEPWIHGFKKIPKKDDIRLKLIQKLMADVVKYRSESSIEIQKELEKKRTYIEKMYGQAAVKGRPSEKLPVNFLPRIENSEEALTNSVSSPTIVEGTHGSFGEILKANTWIRAVNALAKTNTKVNPQSPFSEASCCFSSIYTPGEAIRDANLPPLPELYKLKTGFRRQTVLYTPMIPRNLQPFQATPSLDVAYRVFLQVCWKGPRIGLAHEFGYDNTCDWCNIVVPTNYVYPDVNSQGQPIIDEQSLRIEFDKQGIPLTNESFQMILDASHQRNVFKTYIKPTPPTPEVIIESIKELKPSPIENWANQLEETQKSLDTLSESASDVEIAIALNSLQEHIEELETIIQTIFGKEQYAVLEGFLKESPHSVFEILRSYFLIPSQRILNRITSLSSSIKNIDLSQEHQGRLVSMLENNMNYIENTIYNEDGTIKPSMEKAYLKLQYFVSQLSECLHIGNEIRLSRIRYNEKLSIKIMEKFLKQILRVILFGPIGTLVNSDIHPPKFGEEISLESDKFLKMFINKLINKFREEHLSYEPNSIRQILEESKEREKQRFISEFDKKTPLGKSIEMMNKKYGIGKYAIGGSKLLYKYNKKQWDINDKENLKNYKEIMKPTEDTLNELINEGEGTENTLDIVEPTVEDKMILDGSYDVGEINNDDDDDDANTGNE